MIRRFVLIATFAMVATGCAGWRPSLFQAHSPSPREFVGVPDARDAGRLRAAHAALETCRRNPTSRSVISYSHALRDVARRDASLRIRADRVDGEARRAAAFAYAADRLPSAGDNPCRVNRFSDPSREYVWRRERSAAVKPIAPPEQLPPATPRAAIAVRRARRR